MSQCVAYLNSLFVVNRDISLLSGCYIHLPFIPSIRHLHKRFMFVGTLFPDSLCETISSIHIEVSYFRNTLLYVSFSHFKFSQAYIFKISLEY